jgi:predicted nucleotidyltransferase
MNALDVQLKSLAGCLSSQEIKYVIIGGIAVSVYGEPRFTADIDVNIILDKGEIGAFLTKALRYGFFPAFPHVEKLAHETGVLPMRFKKGKVFGKFDMILAENILEFAAIRRGKIKKIDTVRVRLISPEDLIIHKITSSRPRDLEDLKGILIRQRGKMDVHYIQQWLKKIDSANKGSRILKQFKELMQETFPSIQRRHEL